MATEFSLKGMQAMQRKLKSLEKKFPTEVERALRIEIEVEAKEVKRRTPVDTGALRTSVHVEGPERRGWTVMIRIVAGGPAAPYAVYVHEDLHAFHKTGQAKYIESVIMESRPFLAARLARRIELNRAVA